MNRIWAAVFGAVLLAASGCATLPSPEVMKAEIADYQLPRTPTPDEAMVYVVRPSGLGGLIRFNVFLGNQEDQSEMGYTRASQYIFFSVPPGEHKIYSKAENWAEIIVSAKSGEIVFIRQEPGIGVIMARNSLSRLQEYEGKYFVKRLSAGTMLKSGSGK